MIKNLLQSKILTLDGAMGTMVQSYQLSEDDFRKDHFEDHPIDLKGNNDILVITQPDIILEIHKAPRLRCRYHCNTFNANAISQSDYR